MILGLAVAALWGVGDLFAAIAARRTIGFATLVVAQTTELAICVALAASLRPTAAIEPSSASLLLFVGAVTAIAYGCLYRSLVLGPVALVTPIASAYAIGPIVLAVLVLDERVTPIAAAGIALTMVGVVAATAQRRDRRANGSFAGVPFAFGAMAAFAVSAFLVASHAATNGWLLTLLVSRIGVAVALAAAMVVVPRLARSTRAAVARGGPSPSLAVAAAAGACNLGGTALYAYAGEAGSVAIVSALSALFPLVPILGGLALFRERITRLRVAGIATIVVGLVVLGAV